MPSVVLFLVLGCGTIPLQAAAIRAIQTIELLGIAVSTDSFDSADPAHSINGLYPFGQPSMVMSNGDVCTDATIINAINIGNAAIRGVVNTGPNGTVYLGPQGYVTGGIYDDFNVAFPNVVLPSTTWMPADPTDITMGGKTYDYRILTSGDYLLNSFSTSLYIASNINVRLKIIGNVNLTGGDEIRIAWGASVKFYMNAATFTVSGQRIINENANATNFLYLGLANNTGVTFSGDSNFVGSVYAPSAALTLSNSGLHCEFIGSCMAKSVSLKGHYKLHFDENLYRVGPFPPTITTQPVNRTAVVGQTVTFLGSASGPLPLSYQWFFNETNALASGADSSLALTNVQLVDAGSYLVVVSNAYGSATSAPATLSVFETAAATLTSVAISISNQIQFEISGVPGFNYAVQTSTNLTDWESLATNASPFNFAEEILVNLPQRFYRAVCLP